MVKQLKLTRRARHMQEDDVLRFGGKRCFPMLHRVGRINRRLPTSLRLVAQHLVQRPDKF